jgi:hypothetical protein
LAEFKLGRREFNRKLRLLRLQSSHVSLKFALLPPVSQKRKMKKNSKTSFNGFPVYAKHGDPSALACSLSSRRHSYIGLIFDSRCIT